MFKLEGCIGGAYFKEVWESEEGARASLERRVKVRTVKNHRKIGGYETIRPTGWAAVTVLRKGFS